MKLLYLAPILLENPLSNDIVTLDSIALAYSTTAWNLGVIFNQEKNVMDGLFHLHNSEKIRHILSQKDAEKLVHAFVTSGLDYHTYHAASKSL